MPFMIRSYKYGYIRIRNLEDILTKCRVCGYDYIDYYPWGEDGKLSLFDICDCCGVEFGNEDWIFEGIIEFRRKWLEKGGQWRYPEEKPENWSLTEQLAGLPCELFDPHEEDTTHSPKPEVVVPQAIFQRLRSKCLVCGHDLGVGHTRMPRVFCPCCGVQFGEEDWLVAGILKYRREWIAGGAVWRDPGAKPEGWRLEDALATLPRELFDPKESPSSSPDCTERVFT